MDNPRRIADPGNGFNGLLEPCEGIPGNYAGDCSLSIAMSLKRIADALWGTDGTTGVVQLLNYIESNGRAR